ncbi:retrovirus-related pol polyprotein from [Plakobranchus ocellatus]|uniref:Retrovirus-related pol polyprotein from n=1 Tax=Plakobranchus ocellatus TaxID=259542 RepID=A0AAV4C2H6_9GAST|nr:retrovirus-related pol polyprotein from [Plakobranchus ocellatus]
MGLEQQFYRMVQQFYRMVSIWFMAYKLTETQNRYAIIEKDTFAMVFAMERFHQYVYGRKVKIETDHKPLKIMQHKNFIKCPARIQRFQLKLQRYDYEIKYKKGTGQVLPDALSRVVDQTKPLA